jgi:hypothetical protein
VRPAAFVGPARAVHAGGPRRARRSLVIATALNRGDLALAGPSRGVPARATGRDRQRAETLSALSALSARRRSCDALHCRELGGTWGGSTRPRRSHVHECHTSGGYDANRRRPFRRVPRTGASSLHHAHSACGHVGHGRHARDACGHAGRDWDGRRARRAPTVCLAQARAAVAKRARYLHGDCGGRETGAQGAARRSRDVDWTGACASATFDAVTRRHAEISWRRKYRALRARRCGQCAAV